MKLSKNIAYKIQLISQKIQNGEELSFSEKEFYKKYERHQEHISSYEIELELKDFNIDTEEIRSYLNTLSTKIDIQLKRETNLKRKHYLELNRLRLEYILNNLDLFKHYIEDTYPYERLSIDRYISELINTNSYINDKHSLKEYDLIFVNSYTGEITFNVPTLNLVYEVMDGNMGNYLLLKSYEQRVQGVSNEELIEEFEKLPKKIKGATISSVSRIINYCNQNSEGTIFNSKDVLEFMKKIMDMQNGKYERQHQESIIDYSKGVFKDFINGTIPREEIHKYHVFRFFNSDISNKKFKMLLNSTNYDLNKILYKIKNDELIKRTRLNSEINGYFDEEGYPYIPNIELACEIIDDNSNNYEKLLEYIKTGDNELLESIPEHLRQANPLDMERLVYYGKGRIGNPSNHELESSFYNLEVLRAIAHEQARPKALNELSRLKAA